MSIIFGIRRSSGEAVTKQQLTRLADATERYAPDGVSIVAQGRIGMGFQPYHTHRRSNLEPQPLIDIHGNMLTFDGRLDNYLELRRILKMGDDATPDSHIVLAAFRHWGGACFSKFIGDWALSLWSASEQVVYLARDHAGTRSLFYRNVSGILQWSTYIESLLVDRAPYSVDEEYAACYLCSQPVRDLTPYRDIRAVPPGHYLEVREDRITRAAHWDWVVKEQLRYKTDVEYEEHFLALFKQSIVRRTGDGAPILAQLSGGMDSTSIVCMSDHLRRSQDPNAEILDTVSFYDDSEPNWNERPYFSIVEARRGKAGIHIPITSMDRTFEQSSKPDAYLLPGSDSSTLRRENQFEAQTNNGGYRIILSGIGGDEVLGGVPTPLPELADCLISGNLPRLLSRTVAWCLADRTPLIHQVLATLRFAAGLYQRSHAQLDRIPPWISARVRDTCIEIARTNEVMVGRLGALPNAISNGLAWWSVMETLPHLYPSHLTRHEYRYPYLDRDLVDFLFRIPREQLVRPGRRRSLMRRALANLVPVEVLERRRKAFLIRGPLAAFQRSQVIIDGLFADSVSARCGLIQPQPLKRAISLTAAGTDPRWWPGLVKAICFELWLRTNSGRLVAVSSDSEIDHAMLASQEQTSSAPAHSRGEWVGTENPN